MPESGPHRQLRPATIPAMVDLLECLVQIKALAQPPLRLTQLAKWVDEEAWRCRPGPDIWSPLEVLAHLADAELFHGARLRLLLTVERPTLEAWDQGVLAVRSHYLAWSLERALTRYCTQREGNLELLERCSGEDLGRVGLHRTRGEITVADLVASMLAHDTAHVGQICTRLGTFPKP